MTILKKSYTDFTSVYNLDSTGNDDGDDIKLTNILEPKIQANMQDGMK